MRKLWFLLLMAGSVGAWAQGGGAASQAPAKDKPAASAPSSSQSPSSSSQASSSQPSSPAQSSAQQPSGSSSSSTGAPAPGPNWAPPRSDSVNASALEDGQSSSKDDAIDLNPPPDDAKAHPNSAQVLVDEGSGASDASELHPWDPHRAAKDVEVGDFYFKRKNYRAAEGRYREALYYKDNDAEATYRLAVCLEKMERPDEARQEFQRYLEILPHGPEAENAKKAVERLGQASAKK